MLSRKKEIDLKAISPICHSVRIVIFSVTIMRENTNVVIVIAITQFTVLQLNAPAICSPFHLSRI